MLPADHEERRKAIESPENVAVTAGAGTGKTTLLVSKVVRKVVDEGMDVTRILALTFTEKAANEMRERVRKELAKAGKLGDLDRAEIGTIHSFCAHVLRQFPVEAGVAPDFQVDEGQAFRRLFDVAWPRWLDRELGPDARRPRQWRHVLEKIDLSDLRELAEGLASFAIPSERKDPADVLKEQMMEAGLPAKKPKGSALRFARDIEKIDAKLMDRAVALVSGFAEEFRADYLAQGYVSFEGMLALVFELFHSSVFPNVLELLREKFAFILLDEFQDTDPVQGEILQRLAEGPDGKLVRGKLFLVGDPKQSIYAFRGADIVAYDHLVERIEREGGVKAVLRTNFRSHGEILDLVNGVFEEVIVKRGRLQPEYEAIEPEEGRKPKLPAPQLEAILIEDASAAESRTGEAEAIAEWLESHRDLPFRETAILLKALSDVPVYIEALRSRGIPYIVHGEKFFYGTTEVIDFVNVLRAVENPHDRIALAGVLRSSFGALADQALYERRKALEPREDADVKILRLLHRWHGISGRIGVPELFDAVFEEGYALEIAAMGYHGEQAVANLLKLRQKAEELQAQGGCTLREFLEVAARAIREVEEEGESPLADETLDAVAILSIHRAKGLEFPVVILPDLHRRSRAGDDRTVRYDWPSRTLGVRLGDACDAGGAALAYLDRERRREEEKRLLYVAVTRAREAIVFLGSEKHDKNCYLSLLRPKLEKHATVTKRRRRPPSFQSPPAPAEPEQPDWNAFVARWREREKRAAPPERITTATRMEGEGISDARAIHIGLACHAVLEQLNFKAPAVPEGCDPEAAEILKGFFGSGAFGELADAEILARELPFVTRRNGRIVEGVIDLVYRSDGKLFAADYKSDREIEPERHALIRDVYGEAVRRIFKAEPGFKLFYLRHGKSVEI